MSDTTRLPLPQTRRRDRVILLASTLTVLLFFLFPVLHGTQPPGFPLDDGWIHATYARNLAAHGEFALNPGTPSTGTTSLLWTVLLGGVMDAGLPAVPGAWLLAGVSLLLLVAFWHDLLHDFGVGRLAAFVSAAALPASGILLWWTFSGMETTLFLLLAIVTLHRVSRRDHRGAGFGLALLVLARPEGILLAPALALWTWRRDRSLSAVWPLLAGAAAGALLYVGWNLAVSGAPYTSTLDGRRWLAHGGRIPETNILSFPGDLFHLVLRWLRTVGWGLLRDMPVPLRIVVAIAATPILFGTIRSALAARRRPPSPAGAPAGSSGSSRHASAQPGASQSGMGQRNTVSPWMALVVWVLLHTTAYALLLPYPGHAGRYLAPLLLPLAALLGAIIDGHFRATHLRATHLRAAPLREVATTMRAGWLSLRGWTPRMILLLLVFTPIALYSITTWRMVWLSSTRHIDAVHRRAAEWIHGHTAPNSRIAAFDIGAIAFFSGREVIDLGGLADPAAAAYMNGRIDAFILLRQAEYTAMIAPYEGIDAPGWIPANLGYGRGGMLDRHTVREFHISPPHYRSHIALTGNAYPRMLIDRCAENLQKHTH
ncbi:MAG: hypothetical protein RBU27_10680 [Bacteroidota bacterium]|jgi:hypothetical protein|nr:hypothetical protein [Bacteroidota bacterium]